MAVRKIVLVSKSVDVQIRRVGFREGTDADLRLLHAVEAPIEAERGSNRMPQMLESYVAYARSLPSQFHDHAWLVESSAGDPVAAGYCWWHSGGIDPAHRGLGLAKWAKATMLERLRRERPGVRQVRTGNAFSNGPMLAINEALGFQVISTRTDWQALAAEVRRTDR